MQQPLILGEPIFVGRKTELETLQRLLESMLNGKGSTVLISGAAGSGKTRLVNEFLSLPKIKKVDVLLGWCLSSSNVPYFPFIEAFNSYPLLDKENNSRESISYLASKMASYLAEPSMKMTTGQNLELPFVWKDRTFLAVIKELLLVSTTKPLLLVLEDMHWADTASLALLHYMSRAIGTERIMIVGTYRNEELTEEGSAQYLAKTLHLMGRDTLFEEIKLKDLKIESIGKIAESMLGGLVDPTLVQSISDDSQGNPLFVVESLRMLAENGSLFQEDGKWHVKNRMGIPYKVREIILRRLEALKPEERRILDVASVIGDKFDANLIASVLSIDSLLVLETLNRMFRTTFLVQVEDNVYTFDHAMSREVLYQELSSPLKIGYHERIAEQMEIKLDFQSFAVNQIAFHYSQAGNKAKAIEYSILAGKDALARFSNLEAMKHFKWVLSTVTDDNQDLENRRQALEGLGDAFYANNAFKDAMRTYADLIQISKGTIHQRALVKAMYASFFQGDIQHIEYLLKEAEAEENLSLIEKARILHYKAVIAKKIPEAIKLCEDSLRIFEEQYSLPDIAWLLFAVADFASGQGDMQRAIAYCLRSIEIFEELGDFRSIMEAYNEAGKVFLYCGLYSQAQKMFEKVSAVENETKMGNYIMLAKSNCFLSLQLHVIGDLDQAIEKNMVAIEYSEKANSPLFLPIIYSDLIKQFVTQGNIPKALEFEAKLKKVYAPSKANRDSTVGIYYAIAQIFLLAGQRKYKEALNEYEKVIANFRHEFPNQMLLNPLLNEYAWILEKSGNSSLASKVKDEIQKNKLENRERFSKANIKAYFIIPIQIASQKTFQSRADIVNVSNVSCSVDLDISLPSELKVTKYTQSAQLNKGELILRKIQLQPFSISSIVFDLQAKKTGQYIITSTLDYTDNQGSTKQETQTFNITVQDNEEATDNSELHEKTKEFKEQIQFESANAEIAFNYLTKEFIKDYMQRRIIQEKSGWRSLIEIATNTKIPASSLYSYGKRRSQAIVELQRRGLVEKRFFPGERGRGGRITRLRISYDKDFIKKNVDDQIRSEKKE